MYKAENNLIKLPFTLFTFSLGHAIALATGKKSIHSHMHCNFSN